MEQELIKPYGDTLNDGRIQLAFTLPIECSDRARQGAIAYLAKLNLENIEVVHHQAIAKEFTYFVAFASAIPTIDYTKIKSLESKHKTMDFYQINQFIKEKLGRPLRVVGASIGSDAHTVGIDAIMNMKGFDGNYGLERYPEIEAVNLGAQVTSEELIAKAVEIDADAILVSQTVTQKDIHLKNLTALVEMLEAESLRDNFLLIAGGPRISHALAIELGYDAGLGAGTLPTDVASLIVTRLAES